MQIILMNNDGTSMHDIPRNPLEEKWSKMYNQDKFGEQCSPVLGQSSTGAPIMNYSCVLCHSMKCFRSDNFEVPEEDKEEYEAFLQRLHDYHVLHKNIDS